MTATKTKPMTAARQAAKEEFDAYLDRNNATATMSVPDCVRTAAIAAFREAGGEGEIDVIGSGNRTHPVCSVDVRRAK